MPVGVYPHKSPSLVTRIKLSEALKGKPKTPEHRYHMALAQRLLAQSPEKRARCSLNFKGKPKSDEHKAKLKEARKRQVITEETKARMSLLFTGEGNPFYGKCHTEEAKEKNRLAHLELMLGEKHWNWRGGIGKEPYPFEFTNDLKESIRERDNRICQRCGVPQIECIRKLDIHHIDYNKYNCKPNNLISLCSSCNLSVNSNRNYWQEFFARKLKEVESEV